MDSDSDFSCVHSCYDRRIRVYHHRDLGHVAGHRAHASAPSDALLEDLFSLWGVLLEGLHGLSKVFRRPLHNLGCTCQCWTCRVCSLVEVDDRGPENVIYTRQGALLRALLDWVHRSCSHLQAVVAVAVGYLDDRDHLDLLPMLVFVLLAVAVAARHCDARLAEEDTDYRYDVEGGDARYTHHHCRKPHFQLLRLPNRLQRPFPQCHLSELGEERPSDF